MRGAGDGQHVAKPILGFGEFTRPTACHPAVPAAVRGTGSEVAGCGVNQAVALRRCTLKVAGLPFNADRDHRPGADVKLRRHHAAS